MNIQEPVSEITGFRDLDFRDAGQLVSEALRFKVVDRLAIVDALLRSLDQPDSEIDRLWADEAERRLVDYRAGKVKGIPAEAIFGDN